MSIRVYCDAESHATRRVLIAASLRPWGDTTTQRVNRGQAPTSFEVQRGIAPAVQHFDDAQGVPVDRPLGSAPSSVRRRVALECSLCGLRLVLRAENVQPLVDPLLAAGVTEVSLSLLSRAAARL